MNNQNTSALILIKPTHVEGRIEAIFFEGDYASYVVQVFSPVELSRKLLLLREPDEFELEKIEYWLKISKPPAGKTKENE